MAFNPEPLHAIVIPYPTLGHIIPMIQFAKRLAFKGVTVTFVTTHHRQQQITKAHAHSTEKEDPIEQEARNLGLDIRSAQISDGLPLDFDRVTGFKDFMLSVENMGGEFEKLLHNLNKAGPPISCVIADTLLYWSFEVTRKFSIPWISFWTQPTVVYSIYYYAHLLQEFRHSLCQGIADEGSISIDYIPGVPTLAVRDLPSFLREVDADTQYILDGFSKCLPEGFVDEIKGQGLVVPWCNQLQVLSHPSIAGFITHCGWNSMLESIAFGIPLVGFPFWSEQFTNSKLMADEWKIGFGLSGGGQAAEKGLILREDVSKAIIKLLSDEGKEVRENVQALKEKAKSAVRRGGSSDKNIESFVEGLRAMRSKVEGKFVSETTVNHDRHREFIAQSM